MKKIYMYFSLIMLSVAWSCAEKDNMDVTGDWTLSAPSIVAPAGNATIVLDESEPAATTRFEWRAALASNKFVVQYTAVLLPVGSTDYEHPILSKVPTNAGKDLFVAPTAEEIDYALWTACYPAGATVPLEWTVIAKSIEKTSTVTQKINFTRFETEYIPHTLFLTGDATETGADVSKAMAMHAVKDADGNQTGVFEIYTHLKTGGTYFFRDQASEQSRKMGGNEGALSCGAVITSPDEAEYRIRVDVINNTYDLLKIEHWSLVGDAVEGGWGGDVPLTYVGNGVWEKEIEFSKPSDGASFIIRANGDWGIALKRIKGSATANDKGGNVIMESEAGAAGVEVENMPGTTGLHRATVKLNGDTYSYTLTKIAVVVETIIGKAADITTDAVTGVFPILDVTVPSTLYLIEDGTMIDQFIKDGNVFTSSKYVALQASKSYSINSAADGTGVVIDGDDDGIITVDHDQAYTVTVNFDKKELSWKHYNLKVFNWDDANGGWDARKEIPMTYTHPYTYDVTAELGAYEVKFNSPWDIQFGTDAMALTGTMTNGGENFKGIGSAGSYKMKLLVASDYKTADYTITKQ
jgi:hypothetical protein